MIIKKNTKKKVIIIVSIVILLFLITIVLVNNKKQQDEEQRIQQEIQRVKQYTSLESFQSMEEVALYLNSKLIKQEEVNKDGICYKIYMELSEPVEDKNGNRNKEFYEKLIQYSAYVLKYKNFAIIDETNKATITVYCEETKQLVGKYFINDIENYFEVKTTQDNIKEITEIAPIRVEIESEELNRIISNNWSTSNINLGTIESIYRRYDIYFDEGYEIRNVNQKVFNIVFTNKYKNNILKGINKNTSRAEVINTLGEPHFENGELFGYKCENMYIFFYNNQISIYRIESYETDSIAQLIEKYNNQENAKILVSEIKNQWKDYDIYEYGADYVKLQYTLKGITIKYDGTGKNGVILHNNYSGKAYGNVEFKEIINGKKTIPQNIYIENSDSIFEAEQSRVNTLDDVSKNNNYSSEPAILNTSEKFKTYKKQIDNSIQSYNVRFISIEGEYPNSELKESINQGMWIDNEQFIYSVKNRGIYIYNAKTRQYTNVITGNDEFRIYGIENNRLYYDETSIALNN